MVRSCLFHPQVKVACVKVYEKCFIIKIYYNIGGMVKKCSTHAQKVFKKRKYPTCQVQVKLIFQKYWVA